ncbi:hypothetical protein BDV27DRAFT_170865 [Aspergillus caelatus]|uniref:Heterokaryon incompatibility domain-containing protein n=1 Tax=Aspergillus caelatus TaxID=61420 RepID=A0A5N7AMN7_9EURO|nr:uncharacterized protein BDV27DRAFT_170865 [Aspergillus caelatus]KAE8370258.1 hypothetical protein BDV27DRAFT_170865 [Aspergillus caelatus]
MGQAETCENNVNDRQKEYHYPPLPRGCIRLLRLLPSKDSNSRIQGRLFNYPLEQLADKTHIYEALSYVWGNLTSRRLILLEDCKLPVTANLYTALLSLRDEYIERIIWIDAICINQKDLKERGEQVLQEVAAARQILIKCGLTELDGYVFSTGLTSKSFEYLYKDFPDLHAVVRPVTFLMRESLFRPRVAESTSSELSLKIRPLGELLEMYHTRKATKQHDRLFALLGMSSDDSIPTGLLPDYSIPWTRLFERLIRFLLGGDVSISLWDPPERAVISGQGYILGKVLSVRRNPHDDGQEAGFATRDTDGTFGPEIQWHLPALAKPVQVGDLICQLSGAAKPTIIRLCHYHFSIIMIAAPLELRWSKDNVLLDLSLSWDWQAPQRELSDQEVDRRSLNSRLSWYSCDPNARCSDEADILWRIAIILEEAEEYGIAADKFQQALSRYEETFGTKHPHTVACVDRLALVYKKLGLLYVRESYTVPAELHGLHCSEILYLKDWTFRLKFKQGGAICYGTAFSINVPGVKRAVLVTARCNLMDENGWPSQYLVIQDKYGLDISIHIEDVEVFPSASGPKCASDAGVYSGYGALLVDMEPGWYLRGGYGFALDLGQANLQGDGLGVCGYPKLGILSRSTGWCLSCQDGRMTYSTTAMSGMSGSPVFLSHNGHATAVGIHIDSCDMGGWCMRLTVEVPPTMFDILPLYAPSGTGCSALYVFRFRAPPTWPRPSHKWVQWDIATDTVSRASSLQEPCSVKLTYFTLESGPAN